VLAAQDGFFNDDIAAFRSWLQASWPEAVDLADADLQLTLDQARALYTEMGSPPRP